MVSQYPLCWPTLEVELKKVEKNGKQRSTLEISSEVLRQLKVKCAEKGEPMKARVEGLIKDWLAKEGVRA